MIDFLSTVPHCALYGQPVVAGFHFFGNLMIFLAYMAIPIAIEIVRRLRGIKFNALAALFALFIFLCGFGHLLNIGAMLSANLGWYWAVGLNDVLTGLVSLGTAIYAFKLIPTLMKIPTPEQHELMQETLEVYRDAERWRQTGKPPTLKSVV
jgi:two-component system sensor histidine kinase/response regulator